MPNVSDHKCPAPPCNKRVSSDQLACRGHWYALPADLRRSIWAAYQGRGDLGHAALVGEAVEYLHDRYPAEHTP